MNICSRCKRQTTFSGRIKVHSLHAGNCLQALFVLLIKKKNNKKHMKNNILVESSECHAVWIQEAVWTLRPNGLQTLFQQTLVLWNDMQVLDFRLSARQFQGTIYLIRLKNRILVEIDYNCAYTSKE